jgi:hypothetical protein
MRSRLSIAVFGLAVAALGVSALTVASAASDPEPRQAALTGASSDDDPGDISGPCDEAEHANDPRCTGVSPAPAGRAPAAPAPAPAPRPGTQVIDARGAGTVTYTVRDGVLTLVEAAPAAGWSVEVEQSGGLEIEVDFRSGTQRVQVNVEFEDGQVRERVRVRDDADDSETRFENGVIVRQEPGDDLDEDDLRDDDDDRVDNSGPGSSTSGSHDDDHDNNSGPGGGDTDDDDDDRSGPGSSDD